MRTVVVWIRAVSVSYLPKLAGATLRTLELILGLVKWLLEKGYDVVSRTVLRILAASWAVIHIMRIEILSCSSGMLYGSP